MDAQDQQLNPPVVLIHGALRSRLGMVPPAMMLRRRGLPARTFGYSTRHGTLADHGAALEQFIARWLGPRLPVPVLGFFTHSMGALVARAYLARAGAMAQAEAFRLVMLSPPNRGAALARQMWSFRPFHWLYGDAAETLGQSMPGVLPDLPVRARALILAGGTEHGRGYNRRLAGDDDGLVARTDMPLSGVEPTFVGGRHSVLQWRPSLVGRAIGFLRSGRDTATAVP